MSQSQKIIILLIVGLFLLFTYVSAEGLKDIPDEELNAEVPDVENEVPDVEGFDELTPEQKEEILKFQQQQQQQQDQIYSSPDVDSFWYIPPSNERKFQIGKETDMVLGFENTGSENFRIFGVRGHLVLPNENIVVQNLTAVRYNITVQPEELSTLEYKVFADPRLDPAREYALWVIVFYTNEDNVTFASTFFNETISFFEEPRGFFDLQTIFMFTMLAGLVVVVVFFILNYMKKSSGKTGKTKGSKSEKAPTINTSSDQVDFDLIPSRFKKQFQNQSPQQSPKNSSPQPKRK